MAEERVELTKKAISYIERAITIILKPENKQKYQFLLYNASTTTWHIIRPLLLNNWAKSVTEISQRLSNLLEETDDSDFNWRCRYLTLLYQTLLDADKKPQALKILDKLWDATKKKGDCDFQESLFRLRLHAYRDNAGQVAGLKKQAETGDDSKRQWKPLHTLQAIKSGAIPQAQIQKELQTTIISISPQAINPEQAIKAGGSKISHILQDRLAEAGRIAIQNNFTLMAEGCVAVISKVRTSSLRGKIWTEYTKAQLLLKKKSSETHPKTGMRLNQVQKQIQAYERRVQALKILERTGVANKRLNDANIIAEGCQLIWNTSLPLLRESSRTAAYKPLLSAANMLQMIGSNDTNLRVALHLQLAKCEMAQDFLSKAEKEAKKALKLDYSIAKAKLPPGEVDEVAVSEGKQDVAQMQRQYDKYLKFILKKLQLRQNIYGTPQSVMEQLTLDVQNALNAKNPKMRQTLLEKQISTLQNYKDPEFDVDPSKNEVEEQIKQNQHNYNLKMSRERKNRVLLATEIAKLCYQDGLTEMAIDSAFVALKGQGDPDQWKPKKEAELIVAYSQSHFVLAESYADQLLDEQIEVAYNQITPIQNPEDDEANEDFRQLSPQLKTKLDTWKIGFVKNIQLGVKAAVAVNQSWLTFNGAIILWNNYLPLFKKSNFAELIFDQALPSIQECFEGMNTSLSNYDYQGPQDYFQDKKLAVFTNLGMVLARLHEKNGKNDQALRVCDIQLQKQLPSSLKKSFDTIKARITKSAAAAAAKPAAGGAGGKGGKGGAVAAAADPQALNDAIVSQVVGMIELIINTKQQNPATELVKKGVDQLKTWKPNGLQQADLQMHAELWAKLGRLACNINSNVMLKMSLVCAQTSFKGVPLSPEEKALPKDKNRNWARQVPSTRLRWYSVAQALYGQVLSKLVNQERQQKDSQQKLLFSSVSHFIEAGKLATQAGLGWLLLQCTKSMWNAVLPLLDTEYNRRKLIQPLASIGGYLRIMRQNSDPDFLLLLYSALFACITEHKQWKLGEQVVNQAFQYVPQSHQRPLWEAKMLYYSKLGKNVLNAIANMKESNASLQAKVWVKLARSASDKMDQFNAYQKAILILRKEGSVEAADVMIQFGEWLNRKGYPTADAQDQLQSAVDIMLEIQPGWQEEEQDEEDAGDYRTKKSSQSRSSRSKSRKSKQSSKSKRSKSTKSKSKAGKSTRSKRSKRQMSQKTGGGQSQRSKRTKTKLSLLQQEQEGQPEFLNCTHFDRLFRVHTMLAMLAPDSFKQKQYLMDAYSFLLRIWKQTFLTSAAFDFAQAHRQKFIQSPANINLKDPDARSQFLAQLFLTPQLAEQVSQTAPPLPKTPQDWVHITFNQQELQQHFSDKQRNFYKSLGARIVNAEERTILCLVAIPKPELTYEYMHKMLQMFESHYLHQQMIPVLKTMEIFAQKILKNTDLARLNTMKMARLLMNLGMKQESQIAIQQAGEFVLTDEQRKATFEKIKGLADPTDDLNVQVKLQHFIRNDQDENRDEQPPLALGPFCSHQLWLLQSEQMLKWGKIAEAQILATESALHARVLKQKKVYAKALHILAQIEFLKGDGNQALRYDMQSQSLANNNILLLQSSILQTNNHLMALGRPDDAELLLTRSLEIFESQLSRKKEEFNNLDLVFMVQSLLLETCLHYEQQSIAPGRSFNHSCRFIQAAFELQNRFNKLAQKYGYQQRHLIKLLEFSQNLYHAACSEGVLSANLPAIEFLQKKMEKCGLILIDMQKMLNEQFYFLGLSLQRLQSSPKKQTISLPLCRLLGIVKVRLAQINSTIGVSKTRLKELGKLAKVQNQQTTLGSMEFGKIKRQSPPKSGSQKDQQKLQKDSQTDSQLAGILERAHAGWMQHISRQIDAISQKSAKHFNRYEKSISFLQSALNLLHPKSVQYLQALVELCRAKRLLAENKKHLRGVWQNNAKLIDRYHRKMLKMLKLSTEKQEEVKDDFSKYNQVYMESSDPPNPRAQEQVDDQDLDAMQVNWEEELSQEDKIQYSDATLDYKSQAIKQFLQFTKWNDYSSLPFLNLNYKGSSQITPSSGSPVTSATQTISGTTPQPQDVSLSSQSSSKNYVTPSPLAVFSLEFAQARGNVSPEQAFYYLSLYQFVQSRDFLHNIYSTALGPAHDDNLVLRALKHVESSFSYYTASPIMPEKNYSAKKKEMETNCQAWKVLTQNYPLREVKERLPLQSAYLLIQMSADRQFLYVGYVHAKKLNQNNPPPLNSQQLGQVRELEYENIEKIHLTHKSLGVMASIQVKVKALKHSMLKTPATSEEDLDQLMTLGNQEFEQIVRECEALFGPILQRLNDLINPELEQPQQNEGLEQEKDKQANAKDSKAAASKKDDKKPPAKDAKKGASGGGGGQLAKYQANLPLSNSGVESLVILLDLRISDLPIESLYPFQKIPVVTRDFSLHHYIQRVKRAGHVANVHNNQGISKEALKYIIDIPPGSNLTKCGRQLSAKLHEIVERLKPALLGASSNWDGVLTDSHIPSLGEWQRKIFSSQLFSYWGLNCILHQFPPTQIAHLSAFSGCKAMLLFDRMNAEKVLVDRNSLLSAHYQLSEQPVQIAALLTLIGVNYFGLNQFAMKTEETIQQYECILKDCIKGEGGVYLGAGLKKYRDPIPIYQAKKQKSAEQQQEEQKKEQAAKKGGAKKGGAGGKGVKKDESVKNLPPLEESSSREIVGYKERAIMYKSNALQYGFGLMRVV